MGFESCNAPSQQFREKQFWQKLANWPNLGQCDFFMFPKLKISMKGFYLYHETFMSNVTVDLKGLLENHFLRVLRHVTSVWMHVQCEDIHYTRVAVHTHTQTHTHL
jgi:hypothetical protein